MSLDVSLVETKTIYSENITHNLAGMASAAGLYYPLWRPDEIDVMYAHELIPLLEVGMKVLLIKRDELIAEHSPSNGWGTYEGLSVLVKDYLAACRAHPDAEVRVSR